jgi:predicted nucleic acid-binding protein
MIKYRIYLDNCCFNRPYDDQSYLSIRLESEAKLFIQNEILQGSFCLVWSYILDYENSMNPYDERRKMIAKWKEIAQSDVDFSEEINISGNILMQKGLKNKDALHIACAVVAKCDYFITTDNDILHKQYDTIIVINPIDFVRKLEA